MFFVRSDVINIIFLCQVRNRTSRLVEIHQVELC